MRKITGLAGFLLGALLWTPGRAFADSVHVEDAGSLGRSDRSQSADVDAEAPSPRASSPRQWTGPRVEIGYSYYVLEDGYGGGDTHSGVFGGYIPLKAHWIRLGGSVEVGARAFALAGDDLVLRASIVAGYQFTEFDWPVVPFVQAVGTLGGYFGKRFHTPFSSFLGGGGIELGVNIPIVLPLAVGVSGSWQRLSHQGIADDVWTLKLVTSL